jgi:hypothetical protein
MMNSASQFHSDRFRLIEEDASLRTDDLLELFAKAMRAFKKFASVEERNHNGATARLGHGTYSACSQEECDGSCGSLLD